MMEVFEVGNRTYNTLFESKKDAVAFAADGGICAGLSVLTRQVQASTHSPESYEKLKKQYFMVCAQHVREMDEFERLYDMAKQLIQSPTSKAALAALKNAVEFNKDKFP